MGSLSKLKMTFTASIVTMIMNETMLDVLSTIRRIERNRISEYLDVPSAELGNSLIHIYYATTNLRTRELITEFMNQAGVVWLRKLLTRDTGPIASTASQFASLDDYVELLAANDEEHFELVNEQVH